MIYNKLPLIRVGAFILCASAFHQMLPTIPTLSISLRDPHRCIPAGAALCGNKKDPLYVLSQFAKALRPSPKANSVSTKIKPDSFLSGISVWV